jgi:hypothetical protein
MLGEPQQALLLGGPISVRYPHMPDADDELAPQAIGSRSRPRREARGTGDDRTRVWWMSESSAS